MVRPAWKTISFMGVAALIVLGIAESRRSERNEDPHRAAREAMVRSQIAQRGVKDGAVLRAMREVPRHEFIPPAYRSRPYGDHPCPIGYGQTISQPYIVAYMTEMLEVGPKDTVLEIGTGSGYQAAVLSRIVKHVCSIEIVKKLHEWSSGVLKKLGYTNVTTRIGDGYNGWTGPLAGEAEEGDKKDAPAKEETFDAIIVTCAADHIPPPLFRQLKRGGRMCIPVGHPYGEQWLLLVTKDAEGKRKTRYLIPVAFVPLRRGATR